MKIISDIILACGFGINIAFREVTSQSTTVVGSDSSLKYLFFGKLRNNELLVLAKYFLA